MENKVQELGWDSLKGTLFIFGGLLLLMFFVPVIFQILPRETAGLVAGACFLIASAIVIHASQVGDRHLPMMVSGVVFLFGFAVPILVLRLAFWGVEFNLIQVGALSGRHIHSLSSYVYVAMLLSTAHRAWIKYKNK